MTSLVDVWRAVDPEARIISGAMAAVVQPVRGVARTRTAPPHLPPALEGQLLVADASLVIGRPLEHLLAALREADLRPVGVAIAGLTVPAPEPADDPLPFLASRLPAAALAESVAAYLRDEPAALAQLSGELRLACAEAALAEPEASAPAGLIAARLRRGVAVSDNGVLQALHARPAGRTLAARFAAVHARLLAAGAAGRAGSAHRSQEGMWLIERRIRPDSSVWLFDDVPFAAVDEVAADALTITLRALLRRPAPERSAEPASAPPPRATGAAGATADVIEKTLLAVARANGRIAPAARALGVHRNTVLYRLRRARAERGIDPRRPEDALRILAAAQSRG